MYLTKEIPHEDCVIALHNDTHRDHHGPEYSLAVAFQGLQQGLRMFFVGSMLGIDDGAFTESLLKMSGRRLCNVYFCHGSNVVWKAIQPLDLSHEHTRADYKGYNLRATILDMYRVLYKLERHESWANAGQLASLARTTFGIKGNWSAKQHV